MDFEYCANNVNVWELPRERRNVLPCFPRNTRRVNFYRRGKTQRAKNCIAIFFPRAIFKLLERVRLPSRNSFSSLQNMFMFIPMQRAELVPPLLGIKVSKIPFTLRDGYRPRALWNGLFFIRNISRWKVSSQQVCRPFLISLVRDTPSCRRKKGWKGYARGKQSLPFIWSRFFMPVVNDRWV